MSVQIAVQDYFYHETSLVETPCHIGKGTTVSQFCHVMPGAIIGEDCNLGQNVFIGKNVKIGDNVEIQDNVSVYEGVTLENDVVCCSSCAFTNVKNPRGAISQKDNFIPTLVEQGASIGANATIVCGNVIGKHSVVGNGSVVTSDIPDHAMVFGNPARIHGWVCRCGGRLVFNPGNQSICPECGEEFDRLGPGKIASKGGVAHHVYPND